MGRRNQLSWCVEPQELCWYQRNRRIVKSSRASEMGCSKSSFQGPTTTADCNTRWHLQDSHVRTTAVSLKTFFSYLMRRTLQGRTREASKSRGRQADSSARDHADMSQERPDLDTADCHMLRKDGIEVSPGSNYIILAHLMLRTIKTWTMLSGGRVLDVPKRTIDCTARHSTQLKIRVRHKTMFSIETQVNDSKACDG